jgi:hypothetical protein
LLKKTTFGIALMLLSIATLISAFDVHVQTMHSPLETIEFSEQPVMQWNETYGGSANDKAFSAVQTVDGGYALAGYTGSFGAGLYDFWLVKTDANGNALWNKTYGGTSDDVAYSVFQTSDEGYVLAGYTVSFGAGSSDFWLVKTNPSGNVQWSKTYGGTGADIAYFVIQTSDGGYALAGNTKSFGAGQEDFWLVKTDSAGSVQWNKTYGGAQRDWANSMVRADDGGYALAGWTYSLGAGDADFWMVKTDANGNIQWNETYGGTGADLAFSLVQTDDGGYALAGETPSSGSGSWDIWLVKTDADGNVQWNEKYAVASANWANSVVQTIDGGYALAGLAGSFGAGNYDFWLIKTDASGTAQWNKTYGGTNWDEAFSVVQTEDGGYALAGYTESFGAGARDVWLIKLNPRPEPWIVEPMNSGLLYRPTWDAIVVYEDFVRITAAELNIAPDIVSTLFEYSPDGLHWFTIGIDETADFKGMLLEGDGDAKVGDEGWSIYWNTTGFTEGTYYIRATMMDEAGQKGSDEKLIYYDPTPPTVQIFEPLYNATISGVVEFWVKTPDEDIVYMNLSHCNGTADVFVQDDLGHLQQSGKTCAPTAAANALHKLAKKDSGLYPDPKEKNDLKRTRAMAKKLAKKMNTDKETGTMGTRKVKDDILETDSIEAGIQDYLTEQHRGCNNATGYKVTVYRTTYKNVSGKIFPQSTEATWEAYETELRNGEAVIVSMNPRNKTDGSLLTGHALTGKSASSKVNSDGSHNCGFVDPKSGTKIGLKWRSKNGLSEVEYGGEWLVVNGIYAISPKKNATCHPIGNDTTPENGLMVPWDTTTVPDGYYLVTATVVDAAGNCGTNSTLVYVNNGMPAHDVAITNITHSRTVVSQNYSARINVTLENQGNYKEDFNVTVYANETTITIFTNLALAIGNSSTIMLTWNTTYFERGNYSIWAYAWPIQGEIDIADNTFSDGWVVVTIPSDINGDFKVDIKDLVLVIKYYVTYPGHPNWNPNADVNNDGKVDIKDLVLVIKHFGEHYP